MLSRSICRFSSRLLHLPPDALFEAQPALLSAVGLETSVYPVLHHGHELLVAQKTVAVLVKDLEDGVHHVRTEMFASTDVNSSRKLLLNNSLSLIVWLRLYLGYGFICQGVHPHGDLEIIQIVQKLTEVFELLKSDPLFLLQPDQYSSVDSLQSRVSD